MNLDLGPEDLAFQGEVRAFLAEHLPPALREVGRRATSVFTDKRHSLAWQKILHARGWAAPAWPREHGGPGWSEVQRHLFAVECAAADAPNLAPMSLKMVGPILMRFGAPEQKARYLPRILSGEDYWCQGYSEPGAGSDLAALQLHAVADGDDYVLNGSKIWTTHAQWATHMFCLVRTATEGKPQAGVTFLLLAMDTPGIRVEPIITLAGEHEVNQVFFDDVRVPRSGRLGEENQGWAIAKSLLEFERGGAAAATLHRRLASLRQIAALEGDGGARLLDDDLFRRKLAEAETAVMAVEMGEHRVLAALTVGQTPGPVASLLKVQGSEAIQKLDEIGVEAAGHYAVVHQPTARAPGANQAPIGPEHALVLMARYLNNRAASIYGGSNEIQRDVIARLLLRI